MSNKISILFNFDNSEYYKKCLVKQIKKYFQGTRKDFTIPLVIAGTSFQKQVWSVLQTIPYSETRSYKQLAEIIGNRKAIRIVTGVNGDDQIDIIILYYQVIGANGRQCIRI